MVSVHTSSPPTVHTAYTPSVSVTVRSAIFRVWIWILETQCKLEHRSSERVLQKKKRTQSIAQSRKPSFLNTKYLSIVTSHTQCAYTPGSLFKCNLKKKKASWHKLRLHCNLFPCFPPPSDSEWPHHLAQTTAGVNITLSFNVSTCFVLSLGRHAGQHRWHCTCFWEVSSLPPFQRTGD